MNSFIESGFWILLIIIVHSYLIYPIIIFFISKLYSQPEFKDFAPSISILIAAYNEEKVIEDRIQNINNLVYDFDKVEVLVGSDCSSDSTNSKLNSLKKNHPWLKVFLFDKRRGKASILNDLVKQSKNEILIFTDANTVFDKKAIKSLMNYFQDQTIGGVSGRLILTDANVDSNESVEETKYWKYETKLKKSEGRCGTLIGANGGIFAIRRELFKPIPIEKAVTDDLFISLNVLSKKFKFKYCYESFATEDVGKDVSTEYKRKVRFAATNFQTLLNFKNLLFNQNLLVSYAFWSHKVIRWFFPFITLFVLLMTIYLLTYSNIYLFILILQLSFYFLAIIGAVFSRFGIRIKVFSLPYFFVLANYAIIRGFIKFLRKEHSTVWESTQR
ncbi:MAG: glycosyltransferase [Melioribacteraceae bacterium]|nr:glycosyltransferase [Melioribacteraceae bacterium]